MVSKIMANLIYGTHVLLVVFILFGGFLLKHRYLPYFIIFVILIMMGWNDPSGACLLTTWEHYFRYGVWINKSAEEDEAPEFFRPFIESITRIKMTRNIASKLNNFLFLLVILLSFIKYYRNRH